MKKLRATLAVMILVSLSVLTRHVHDMTASNAANLSNRPSAPAGTSAGLVLGPH